MIPPRPLRPPPMPQIAPAGPALDDLVAAAERARAAWNPAQLDDALRSVEFFVQLARQLSTKGAAVGVPH